MSDRKEYFKKYREEHKEAFRIASQKYRDKNRKKYNEHSNEYRKRKRKEAKENAELVIKQKEVLDKIKKYAGELRLFDNESVEFEISSKILELLEEIE